MPATTSPTSNGIAIRTVAVLLKRYVVTAFNCAADDGAFAAENRLKQ
ncbi:MAG: hypothetical protein K2Y02_07880 [Burkholderiaceae bacterium]|nr:hypothetical protein [Burkholderiaceae bacterium]